MKIVTPNNSFTALTKGRKSYIRQVAIMTQCEKAKLLIVCYQKAFCDFSLQLGNAASLAFRSEPYKV